MSIYHFSSPTVTAYIDSLMFFKFKHTADILIYMELIKKMKHIKKWTQKKWHILRDDKPQNDKQR